MEEADDFNERTAMRPNRVPCLVLMGSGLTLLFGLWPHAEAQQIHRNGFEAPRNGWSKHAADVAFEVTAHAVTDQAAHDGQRSEYLRLDAKQGNFIHYQYPIGKAVVSDELIVNLFLKANRPGMQILA